VFSKEVPQGIDMNEAANLAAQMNISMAELLGGIELTKAPIAWKYVYGQPLVDNEKLRQMPTNLRNFHEWYMRASKYEQTMLVVKVPVEYSFRQELIHIDFSEFF
jgi:hypothetical protein